MGTTKQTEPASEALDGLMRADPAAKDLRISRRTLDDLRKRNAGPPYFTIGGKIYYSKSDLRAWVLARRQESEKE